MFGRERNQGSFLEEEEVSEQLGREDVQSADWLRRDTELCGGCGWAGWGRASEDKEVL